LEGDTGLLFTDEPPKVVVEWFDDYVKADYARKGNLATETVELPAGRSHFSSTSILPKRKKLYDNQKEGRRTEKNENKLQGQ
jgi:hypothetical protein